MFEKLLKRSSWTDIVISLIFVLLGILLIAKPDETVAAISMIFGILFIAIGVLKLVEYYTGKPMNERLKEEIKDAIGLLAMSIKNNTELQKRQLQVLETVQYLNQELVEYTNKIDLQLCKKFSLLLSLEK